MLFPGQRLGAFVIEAFAGEGGMGVVYRARDGLLGRLAAIKVVRGDELEGDALPRLLREARIAAELRHPAIATLYEAVLEGEIAYLAFEWVEGENLQQYLERGTAAPLPQRLEWLRTLADVLAYAHERGVIHRDVKPANVMIDADGSAKLLDFGIAKHDRSVARANPMTFDTSDVAILGTPRYMAPEQARADVIDARVDQFAWGALAYELLSGKPAAHCMRAPKERFPFQPPRPLAEVAPSLPERIAAIVDRSLSSAASARFPTMRALLAEWPDADAKAVPVQASERSARAVPRARSSRLGSYAIALGATLVVGLVGLGAWLRTHPFTTTSTVTAATAPPAPAAQASAPDAAVASIHDASPVSVDSVAGAKPQGFFAADHGGRCVCRTGRRITWEERTFPDPSLCPAALTGELVGRCYIPDDVRVTISLCRTPIEKDHDKATFDLQTQASGECKSVIFPWKADRRCTGYTMEGEKADGKLRSEVTCKEFASYGGPQGARCRGYDSARQLVEGRVECEW